jgi:predicted transcriptional regulator of viral defense system
MAVKLASNPEWLSLALDWERAGRRLVTIDELEAKYGRAAYNIASRLTHRGVLSRLGQGIYAVKPLRSLGRPYSLSPLAAVGELLKGQAYYCGGLSVLNLHGLTEQVYSGRVDVFVTKRRRRLHLAGAQVLFHAARRQALDFGVVQTTIDGIQVRVSDPERTLIDLLEYPQLGGGGPNALDVLTASLPRISARRLVEYARRLAHSTTCRRIGLILEAHGFSESIWHPLLSSRRGVAHGSALVRDAPKKGAYNSRWRLLVNHDIGGKDH